MDYQIALNEAYEEIEAATIAGDREAYSNWCRVIADLEMMKLLDSRGIEQVY